MSGGNKSGDNYVTNNATAYIDIPVTIKAGYTYIIGMNAGTTPLDDTKNCFFDLKTATGAMLYTSPQIKEARFNEYYRFSVYIPTNETALTSLRMYLRSNTTNVTFYLNYIYIQELNDRRIGIGTNAPGGVLDVNTNYGNRLRIENPPVYTITDPVSGMGAGQLSAGSARVGTYAAGTTSRTLTSDFTFVRAYLWNVVNYKRYKVVITFSVLTADVALGLGYNDTTYAGLTSTTIGVSKTHTTYINPTVTGELHITITGDGNNRTRSINITYFDIQEVSYFCDTTITGASKIGNWYMTRPQDNNQYCMGTNPGLNDFALYQNQTLTILNTTSELRLSVLDSAKVTVLSSGNVGIGKTVPLCPLHIAGSGDITTGAGTFFSYNNTSTLSTSANIGSFSYGLYVENNVRSGGSYVSSSDRRIKTNIVDVNDDSALKVLRLLKPKTYTYKDTISRGTEPVYGFIAQEVKDVLNYSSSVNTETIPNVYEVATVLNDRLVLQFNSADLSRDASGALFTKLKVKTRDLKDEFVNILEVVDEHTIKVDKDLTEWGGALDASGLVVPGDKIFVYGQEVNDFHTLNKDAIWTVATAALQEVDRQLQAEKQKTATLETTLASTQATLAAVLVRLDTLEQRNA